MPSYKLQNTKPGESPDEAVIRCANNLLKACLAAGHNICCSTGGISGVEVSVFRHIPDRIYVQNITAHTKIEGRAAVRVPFAPRPEHLEQDDSEDA